MLGEKIKQYRIENNLTQKELADKVFVTAQAVSRWENNEVEPSISTLTELAKIFDVSISEFFGEDKKEQEVAITEVAKPIEEPIEKEKVVLAVCEHCNKPIYEAKNIVRKTEYYGDDTVKTVLCKTCDEKIKKNKLLADINRGLVQRKKSFWRSGIFTALIFVFTLIVLSVVTKGGFGKAMLYTLPTISLFPFFSCLYLRNNFVEEMFSAVASWGIRFPGLIFTLDLDGILWLITVKITFWILGAIISLAAFVLALVLSVAISLFVYPFALTKNFRYPQHTEIG